MRTPRRELFLGRVFLILLMAFTVLPLVTMFSAALAPSGSYPNGLEWPSNPQWGNFVEAFNTANMGPILVSSLIIVVGVVPLSMVLATMAGFGLGHLRPPGAGILFLLFLLGLTLPFQGVITPLYYEMQSLGLIGSRLAIMIPLVGLFMPFSVYWMRAHFINVPPELSEAARVDGANTWQLFWRIHVPIARPALASLGILLFLFTWNQFLLPIVMTTDATQRTMAGALGTFQGRWAYDTPLLCAGALIILTPTIVVFVIFQRQFVTALLQGSVKG